MGPGYIYRIQKKEREKKGEGVKKRGYRRKERTEKEMGEKNREMWVSVKGKRGGESRP